MSDESGTVAAVSRNEAHTFTKPNRDEIVLVAGLGVEEDIHAGVTVRHRGRVAADPHQPNLRQVHLIHAELFEEVAGKGFQVPAGGIGENVTTRGIDLLGLPRGTILRFGRKPSEASPPGSAETSTVEAVTAESVTAESVTAEAVTAETVPVESVPVESVPVGSAAVGSPVGAVLAAAEAATLDEATARAAAAVAAAVERDAVAAGMAEDPRPAVVVAGLRNPCAQINGFRAGLLKEVLGRDEQGHPVRKAGVMGVVLRGGPVRPGDPIAVELPPGEHGPLERV
jgi:MOSC domain-containing protein YiiM